MTFVSDGQLQSFVLWISTHLSLRVSHSSLFDSSYLGFCDTLLFWFSSCKPLYQSPSEICVFIHLSGATCFSQVTLSPGPSPFLLASPMCFMKTAHVYFEVESLTWICFPFFSPTRKSQYIMFGRMNYFITCWCILPTISDVPFSHLSLYCPSPLTPVVTS